MKYNIDEQINKIEELLQEETTYSIAKATGLKTQALDKFKNGKSEIKNMRLGTAQTLLTYLQEKESK